MQTYFYLRNVKILVRKTLLYYAKRYPKAETALMIWFSEFSRQHFRNFNELKMVYGSASIVNNNRVVFNIKGNDFRLVVSINFEQAAAYIIWFGNHQEYNKIDVQTISFDTTILNNK
jgi:mRNA interferase HigB